ncbi:MAG: SH3 domain-containing protein [bacterium]|nr:SH3 domain-containing protein [bacterium]
MLSSKSLRVLLLMTVVVLAAVVLVLPFGASAQTNGARECRIFSAESNNIALIDVPENAVSAGAVFCRFIAREGRFITDRGELGNRDVLNEGVIHAVDIFATTNLRSITRFDAPVRVCLRGQGALIFLDSSQNSTRAPRQLVAFRANDYTCADIDTAGTVVLTGSTTLPAPAEATPGVSAPGTTSSAPVASGPVSNCRVTTRAILNLRAEASTSSTIITTVPYNVTLQAVEKAEGWYRVVYQDGQGWLSARFLNRQGTC